MQGILDDAHPSLLRLGAWDVLTVHDLSGKAPGPRPRAELAACAWVTRLAELDPSLGQAVAHGRRVRQVGRLQRRARPAEPASMSLLARVDRTLPGGQQRVLALWCRRPVVIERLAAEGLEALAERLVQAPGVTPSRPRRAQLLLARSTGLHPVCGPDLLELHGLRDRLTAALAAMPADLAETTFRLLGAQATWVKGRVRRTTDDAAALTVVLEPEETASWEELCVQAGLTDRESQVGSLTLEGAGAAAIAWQLKVSPRTVKRDLTALYRKTGLEGRRGLLAFQANQRAVR